MSNQMILRHMESQCKYPLFCVFVLKHPNTLLDLYLKICVYKCRYYFISSEKGNQSNQNSGTFRRG